MSEEMIRYYADLNARRTAVPDPCCDRLHSEESPCYVNAVARGVNR